MVHGSWFMVNGSRFMAIMVHGEWFMVHEEMDITQRLQDFIESEGKSCSMDIGGITPEYVYSMLGGTVPLDEIEKGMKQAL